MLLRVPDWNVRGRTRFVAALQYKFPGKDIGRTTGFRHAVLSLRLLQLTYVRFPIGAVKLSHAGSRDRAGVETADIYAVTLRMRPRDVKGLDSAVAAKQMLGDPRIESVAGQYIITL